MKERNLLMAVYSSIEYYPPSLNALFSLVNKFDTIRVVTRNVKSIDWQYPNHVEHIQTGKFVGIRAAEQKPLWWKIFSFLQYTVTILKILRTNKPELIILYDSIPVLSYHLIRPFLNYLPTVWYHNHDIIDTSRVRKYSIAWWAAKMEQKALRYIDVFSLPTEDRKPFFDFSALKGKYYFVPNLPRVSFYQSFYQPKNLAASTELKLLYQGTISEGHGLQAIIRHLVGKKIAEKTITLHLIGWITDDYKKELLTLACALGKEQLITFQAVMPYYALPLATREHHVGLAIHEPINVNFITAGTASNKIYEYAALGLPILLYKNEHYQASLQAHPWAYFTDLSEDSLTQCIVQILATYEQLSAQAHQDFMDTLNFEKYFMPIMTDIEQLLSSKKTRNS